jgi:O-antigen/teichoic acid export membrane protein
MSEIAKKSVEIFLTRVLLQLLSIAGAIVIARSLGTSGKGIFAFATSLLAMAQMCNAGQSSAIAWQYTKRHRSPAALFRAMLIVLGALLLPAIVGLVLAGRIIPGQESLIAVALALPFALFTQSSTGFFLSDSDVRTVNVQQILISALPVLAYIPLLLFVHVGLGIVFALWAAGFVIAAVYTAFAMRRYYSMRSGEDDAPIVREQLNYGVQVSMNSAMAFLNFRIDVFLIMFMLGHSALGIYSIGIGIGEVLWQLSRPISTAAFGRISRGEERDAADVTAACVRHSFALVLLAAIVVFFFAPPLVPLIYGKAFAPAGTVARVLLPGIVAYSMMPTLATFFSQQLGQPRLPLLFSTISTLICAAMTVLLLPHVGIVGGAIATSVSYVAVFAAAAAYFIRRTRIAPRKLFTLSRSDLQPYRTLFLGLRP